MASYGRNEAATIKNTWKSNNYKEIKPTWGNIAHHGQWAPLQLDRCAYCHAYSDLLSLLLLLGSSWTMVLGTVCLCWDYLGHFCYLL